MIVSLCNIENSFDSFLIEGDSQINQNGMSCFKQVFTLVITISLDKVTQIVSSKIGYD